MATGTLGDVRFVNPSLNPLFSVQDTCPLTYQRISRSETLSGRLAPPTPKWRCEAGPGALPLVAWDRTSWR